MNLTIIAKNHAADSEIGFLAKSISKFNGCATAKPTTWELSNTQIYMTEIRNEIKKKEKGNIGSWNSYFQIKNFKTKFTFGIKIFYFSSQKF